MFMKKLLFICALIKFTSIAFSISAAEAQTSSDVKNSFNRCQQTVLGVFSRDDTNQSLGIAWKDPSGMIWGDSPKTLNGSYFYKTMSYSEAKAYCADQKATLPSVSDVERLAKYMGITEQRCYTPQVLTGFEEQHSPTVFWADDTAKDYNNQLMGNIFSVSLGQTAPSHLDATNTTVRCVMQGKK